MSAAHRENLGNVAPNIGVIGNPPARTTAVGLALLARTYLAVEAP